MRLGDTSAAATTLYIDEDKWVVGRLDGMTEIPGLGRLGQALEFGDFRDVDGMLIPYRIENELANPMIGKVLVVVKEAVTGDAPAADHFRLGEL